VPHVQKDPGGNEGREVIQNKHSNPDRSLTDLQGESSYRRAGEEDILRRSRRCSQKIPCIEATLCFSLPRAKSQEQTEL
jgi:hypothetical protein